MNQLVVKTTEQDLIIYDIKHSDIFVDNGIMYFGEKAAINLNNFIGYNFVQCAGMNNIQE